MSFSEVVRQCLEEERGAIRRYRERAGETVNDPELRSFLLAMADVRARLCSLLERQFDQAKSQEEITRQINDMFC